MGVEARRLYKDFGIDLEKYHGRAGARAGASDRFQTAKARAVAVGRAIWRTFASSVLAAGPDECGF